MATVSSPCTVFPILTSTLSKPHLAPLSCRTQKRSRVSIVTSVAEDREIVPVSEDRGIRLNEVDGFQPSEPHTESDVVVPRLTSSSTVNAIIVLGFGTFAVTKLLTIDHDYWHVRIFSFPYIFCLSFYYNNNNNLLLNYCFSLLPLEISFFTVILL